MKDQFKPGDRKRYERVVGVNDIASFESGVIHEVCATFTLAQAMEWASRMFVLEMKEPHEEGIGTSLSIKHISPAFVGELLEIDAVYVGWENNELICDITVFAGRRLVATGRTGQKIKDKEKIKKTFNSLRQNEGEV